MSSDFNPYREWLSIPLSEQPANYYRLLGVPLFEPDPNVISNAADRQMTFIRTFQMGKYAQQSQQILNELAAARVTLLNKQKKAQYDAKLRAAQGRQSSSTNTPANSLLNNNIKKQSTPSQYTPSHTPSAPLAVPSDTPSTSLATPPSVPSNTPSVPSRTPLLTPSLTMSVPSITPPSTTPNVISITPPPPVPQPPTVSSATPTSEFSHPSQRRSSKNKDVPPLPSRRSKNTQNSSESKTSNFKKRWIAILISIIAIPLIIYGSSLVLNHSKSSLSETQSQEKELVFEPGVKPGERKSLEINGVEFAFRWCPPGTFTMGSPDSEVERDDNETQHEVALTEGFWILETEITVGMFNAFVNDTGYVSGGNTPYGYSDGKWEQDSRFSWHNPGFSQDDSYPATCISWNDAMEFCKWLSKKTGQSITLPTEAQWEYACRAGSKSPYFWGSALNGDNANCNGNYPYGTTIKGPNLSKPVSVRSYQPNAWGVYDMHGNVWEWCLDGYSDYPSEKVTDPFTPGNGVIHVFRGGSWSYYAERCRSAYRAKEDSAVRLPNVGGRCVVASCTEASTNQSNTVSYKKAGDRAVKVVNGVNFVFRWCPAGTFLMGTLDGDEGRSDENQHEVTLTKGFWMMETEVTQKQWEAIMGENHSYFFNEDNPVDNVSWEDSQVFCTKCAELGLQVQLPTEAQWEYACRAGTTEARSGKVDEMGWYGYYSCGEATHSVGMKKPNPWGLYDMYGNLEEWCQDWYSDYPIGSVTDPTGPLTGERHVCRGGCWRTGSESCRSASRDSYSASYKMDMVGFRCVSFADLKPLKPGELEALEKKERELSGDKKKTKPVVNQEYFQSGKNAGDRIVKVVNGVEFAFCWCPPGDFMMGSPETEEDRFPQEKQHEVTLTQGFWIMETEVSQKQWKAIMGKNPSYSKGDNLPVEQVTWYNCQEFCEKCAELGFPVQLPTEAQWEYACRAGTTGAFAGSLDEMAWYIGNSGNLIHPVKTKKPNAWGIYDMHGNVNEWCADWFDNYPIRRSIDPTGPSTGECRVTRGGCKVNRAGICRSAFRGSDSPIYRIAGTGFRCVSPIEPQKDTIDAQAYSITGKRAGERAIVVVNNAEFVFCWCPAGTFMMGSPESEEGHREDENQHEVTLTKGFWMLETEVTQKQWEAIMGENPSSFVSEDYPVDNVSWDGCRRFCKECANLGFPVELPTEAQWEYACRAGTMGAYSGELNEIAWSSGGKSTHPCRTKKPNAWGLYDMHGNVEEWCQDWYSEAYPSGGITDPMGPMSGSYRVIRGGGWCNSPYGCRSASRSRSNTPFVMDYLGFRCVSSLNMKLTKPREENINFDKCQNAGDRAVRVVNGIEFAFRWCPPGTYTMGSPESERGRWKRETQRSVVLTEGFWMMETEVTVGMFKAFVNETGYESKGNRPVGFDGKTWDTKSEYSWLNPGYKMEDSLPVSCISLEDAIEFGKWLESKIGYKVQLPLESQWEYACRAGTTGACAGNQDEMTWYDSNSKSGPHPVGTKKPNPWGLYDMHGNIGEWCLDLYDSNLGDNGDNNTEPQNGDYRVSRGGFWFSYSHYCRSAYRDFSNPDSRAAYLGFRLIIPFNSKLTNVEDVKDKTKPVGALTYFASGKTAGDRITRVVNGVEFSFCWCPPGDFIMGSPETEDGHSSDELQHDVKLTQGFWIMETEVSQKQWKAIMGTNPSYYKGDDLPVEELTWNDCQEFCEKCAKLGFPVQLPTEAQWEYACRAGTTGAFAGDLDEIAWYDDTSGNDKHPVKMKKPNAWGIYDMHGNVDEWCADWFSSYSTRKATNPTGPSTGECRVSRSGSWYYDAKYCRSASRDNYVPIRRSASQGFRCVSPIKPKSSTTGETVSSGGQKETIDSQVYSKKAGDRAIVVVNDEKFVFRWCPAGTFIMGSPESEKGRGDDEKQHEVTLTKGFWMLETEVTQKQWQAIMGENPSSFVGEDLPVDNVSWEDCQDFCDECTNLGLQVQLPTEAQWEYACRAGTTGTYSGNVDEMAWCGFSDSGQVTHPCGTKKPNPWGLYDMYGNAEEWCQDWYSKDYPSESVTDPIGPLKGTYRVIRGGCWRQGSWNCRSAFRDSSYVNYNIDHLGFRIISLMNLRPAKPGEIESYEEKEKKAKSANNKKETKPIVDQEYFHSGKSAGDRVVKVVKGVEFAFRWCPSGDFMMGSPETEDEHLSHEKQHKVTLTKGFWMMETEVTQKQWQAIMGNNPSKSKGDNFPVNFVTWYNCQEFCEKCAELGFPVQLPTESQWEYACRAGTTGAFAGVLDEIAWYENNSGRMFHPVGTKKPNAWGLYDMHGSVWEWCADGYEKFSDRSVTDPTGPSNSPYRVSRSGSAYNEPEHCRSACRSYSPPIQRIRIRGFRCVSPIESKSSTTGKTGSSDGQKVTIDTQNYTKKAGNRAVKVVNGVMFVFRWCPPGKFLMGSPEDAEEHYDDEKQHEVTLTKGFWMLETEVTQKQWQAIMGENPSDFVNEDNPVDNVSWDDCQIFFKKCAELGFQVQLPTEAQWEYACRAGTTGAFAGNVSEMGWFGYNDCGKSPQSVGKKKPNPWGLYDMHGNLEEWCQDWYSDYPDGSVTDPTGPSNGSRRVCRGGSWRHGGSWSCKSAARGYSYVDYRIDHLGFRIISLMNLVPAKPGEIEALENKERESADNKKGTKPVVAQDYFQSGKNAGDRVVKVVNGVEFAFCWCPPGTFMMGSSELEDEREDNEKQHEVTLTKGFWIMETEVTQKQWKAIMGNNPSYYKGDDLPVEYLTWNNCHEFCEKCAELGFPVQLPTEAQWEYACRAGTTGAYAGDLDEMAWYKGTSGNDKHPVKMKKPNAWGIYDMHGNVDEWCADWFDSYPIKRTMDPTGPSTGSYRVSRSGRWYSKTMYCRSAFRGSDLPIHRSAGQGFRCMSPIESKSSTKDEIESTDQAETVADPFAEPSENGSPKTVRVKKRN